MVKINFVGKEKAEHLALSLIKAPLETTTMSRSLNDYGNIIIQGDNLSGLKTLLPVYGENIKCAYIDPPYNTGSESWNFNDNLSKDSIESWFRVEFGEGAPADRHDKWLCFMLPRLILIRQMLSDNGVVFISIDDIEYAGLKILMDEIFGEDNFLANLVWDSPDKERYSTTDPYLSNEHEYILVYAKNIKATNIFPGVEHPIVFGWRSNTGDSGIVGKGIYTADGVNEFARIFSGVDSIFAYPKPSRLIKDLLRKVTQGDDIVLDCFAGSGTTGQVVAELNQEDGGKRRFILIEEAEYAKKITAERIRRTARNVDFNYYTLAE